MQKKRQFVCFSGLYTLFLGLTLLLSQFALGGQAYAQVASSATMARARTASISKHHATNLAAGKLILVSLSKEWMYVYQDGQLLDSGPVTTGQPSLPTPTGIYHVFLKESPVVFHSPWPKGSRYYYAPTKVNYGLEWRAGGYFIHDSWWHTVYGPGTNGWHQDPTYGWQWGSHGCISMPLDAVAWLYKWAPIGTTVEVVR